MFELENEEQMLESDNCFLIDSIFKCIFCDGGSGDWEQ
ncbi:hypothetical protein Clo1100_3322 [Clostridium sp. BNL1100]|nr:hypothetical protein Clo1100_3322 [Clostridium sp. BNL1100]